MKTGDTVRDAKGRSFQVGQLLGRGLWGRTYSARDEATGSNWVLKVPHRASDLPDHDAALAEACVEIALEQSNLLERAACPALPRLECRLALPDGTPALVMPRANATLEQRLSGGAHMDEVLGLLVGRPEVLRELTKLQHFHGNLKPTNILVSESGAVLLADPVTPALRRHWPRLLAAARGRGPVVRARGARGHRVGALRRPHRHLLGGDGALPAPPCPARATSASPSCRWTAWTRPAWCP